MSQNTSHAVMAQRSEPHDSLDDFPTPPWATRALIEEVLQPELGELFADDRSCWEPACGRGYMADALRPYFRTLYATDVHMYGYFEQGTKPVDFLWPYEPAGKSPIDWVITNPPYRLAEQFIERAREVAREGVAMLVRTQFLEGVGRYERIYRHNPPTIFAQFSERVPMHKGKITEKGSTATAYAWFVWIRDSEPQPPVWIPPCRTRLERPGDYDER